MKRNIRLFKTFYLSFLVLLTCINTSFASEPADTISRDPMDLVDISLLTCEPHDEVYSLYGHTAIRITDRGKGADWAVNWGVFDSTADYFVLRFVFGLTDYTVAIYDFQTFLSEYRYYGCAVHQQRLNLSAQQKKRFLQLLNENIQPANAIYRYNFYYNNCTTKARDIIYRCIEDSHDSYVISVDPNDTDGFPSFRDLIHSKNEEHRWARFGNDLLLGVRSDHTADYSEREFLPEVLMRHFAGASIAYNLSTRPLVDTTFVVLPAGVAYHPDTFLMPLSPTACAVIFLCVIMALCIMERFIIRRHLPWLTFLCYLPYALTGIILTAMLFSKHPTVNVNLQILIANPVVLVLVFPLLRWKRRWHTVLALTIIFFIGNISQHYAEGINIMALALLILSINNIISIEKRQ